MEDSPEPTVQTTDVEQPENISVYKRKKIAALGALALSGFVGGVGISTEYGNMLDEVMAASGSALAIGSFRALGHLDRKIDDLSGKTNPEHSNKILQFRYKGRR